MLVLMKPDVTPLCDVHHKPMQLAQFQAANIGLTFVAHKCSVPLCSRAYQHGMGYHDITDRVSFDDVLRRDCPEDDMTMYLAEIDANGTQLWRCGQIHCEYSEYVNPNDRFKVFVNPIEVQQERSEDRPFAQFEAHGTLSEESWSGPAQPWQGVCTILLRFGQNQLQIAGIKNSLLQGRPAQLVGEGKGQLVCPERQLRKAGLRRLPAGITTARKSFLPR